MKRYNKPMAGQLRYIVFFLELAAAYGIIGYASHQLWISRDVLYLALAVSGLVASLYYGVRGAIAAAVGSVLIIYAMFQENTFSFFTHHYIEISFFLAALLITGFFKAGMENRVVGMELSSEVLNRRLERLTVELSEKDRALQEALVEVLTDMESPKIMYQALRRTETIGDRQALFDEILYILYTHCHIEKSGIYEPGKGRRFKKIATFGASNLPDDLDWGSTATPEILRVVMIEREVIVPTQLNHRLAMAIPILSISDDIRYIFLIEEIRFINFNENVINLLKVAAFWIKYLVEHQLNLNALLDLSVFPSVVVYGADMGRSVIKKSLAAHQKYNLPFALLSLKGEIAEEKARNISKALRLYDDLILIKEDELIIVLSMVTPQNVPFVLARLRALLPGESIQHIEKVPLNHGQ